jgi:hypothetical protein
VQEWLDLAGGTENARIVFEYDDKKDIMIRRANVEQQQQQAAVVSDVFFLLGNLFLSRAHTALFFFKTTCNTGRDTNRFLSQNTERAYISVLDI